MDKNYDDANDLIKRLRNNKVTLGHGEYGVDPLCEEAADEIERLRAALLPFVCDCSSNCAWERDEICPDWNARAVLEGK